jgi:hypothetical protein
MGKVLGAAFLAIAAVVAYVVAAAIVVGGATYVVKTVWFW